MSTIPTTRLRTVAADGVNIFYRESGRQDAPVILLLHGFPTSSHMFRELIPRLAGHFRVIAPDLPGFGFTSIPAERGYTYSFESLAGTLDAFTDALGLKQYALYVFDYGAPVGLRHALAHPDRITGLVSQNGNAYVEGLSDAWNPIQKYWQEPTSENRDALRAFLAPETTQWQYEHGVPAEHRIAPETYTLDAALLQRPGQAEIQLDLFLDYGSNVKLYPAFQKFLREQAPKTLVIWGKNDPFFIPPGAEAYRRDLPNATVTMLDTGHFALETDVDRIADAIVTTLAK